MSYTPGPWFVDDSHVRTAINAKDKHVAMVNLEVPVEEHKGNVNLIAAAPDMLDALESCLSYMVNLARSFGRNTDELPSVLKTKQAIAKAKGVFG